MPLLLSIGEDEAALRRAISSGSGNLTATVLLQLERQAASAVSGPASDAFMRIVHACPEALSMLKVRVSVV